MSVFAEGPGDASEKRTWSRERWSRSIKSINNAGKIGSVILALVWIFKPEHFIEVVGVGIIILLWNICLQLEHSASENEQTDITQQHIMYYLSDISIKIKK